MEEVINLILNSGVSVGCLVYFMWYNSKQGEKNNQLLIELKGLIEVIYDKLNKEDK